MTSRRLKAILCGSRKLSEADRRELCWLFEHTHTGIRGHVTSITLPDEYSAGISVSGNFVRLSDGTRCGRWQRVISLRKRQILIEHARCSLQQRVRGQGIGRAWVRTCIRRYRTSGVRVVEVTAGSWDGGYVWATLGFQWSDIGGTIPIEEYVEDFWRRRRGVLRTIRRQGHLGKDEYQAICRRFERLDFKCPQDVLRLGRRQAWIDEKGRRQWVGKRLLAGSNWVGTLDLHA